LILPTSRPLPGLHPNQTENGTSLKQAARQLETAFISEMLRAAGAGKARSSFGGGPGEQAFSSFLADAQAKAIESVGGFGLADDIYRSLKARAQP